MAWHTLSVCVLLTSVVLRSSTAAATAANPTRLVDGWGEWSDWGPCSQPCDGGVTRQTRVCHREHGCPGLGVRRQMCNLQVCKNVTGSREAQCAAYDHRRHSDGHRYRWRPHPDPAEPCALTCRAIGTDLVRQLSPRVIDGTRCRNGSLDICIDGKCEPLGCDLRIGSNRTVDICGVCGGDDSSCSSEHHFWKEKTLAPCSVTCGGGFQVIRPACRSRETGVEVADQFCDYRLRPQDRLVECGLLPCQASWITEEWTECSATCEGGHKKRKVWCSEMINATLIQVPGSRCSEERPSEREPCNFVACPKWYQGPWSECSVTCGDTGQQTRAVFCRDARGHLSDSCDPGLKPAGRQPCPTLMSCPLSQVKDTHGLYEPYQLPLMHQKPVIPAAIESSEQLAPSTDPQFVSDTWGECSVTCGEGLRRRKVECKVYLEFSQTVGTLPFRECGRYPPADLERCILPPCRRYGLRSGDSSYHQPFRQQQEQDQQQEQEHQQQEQRSSDKTPRHTYDALYDVNDPPERDHFSSYELPLGDTAIKSDPFSSPELNPLSDPFGSPEVAPHDDYRDGDDPFASPEVRPFGDDFGSPEMDGMRIEAPSSRHQQGDPFSSPEHPMDSMVRLRTHLLGGTGTYEDVSGSLDLLGRIRKNGRGGGRDELEKGVVVIRPKAPSPPPPEQLRFAWKKAGFTPCSSSCLGGVQVSKVQCVRVSDGVEVKPSHCDRGTLPDSLTRTCNDHPCPPRWNVTEFSACSRRCGKGIQTREVSCIHELARGNDNTLPVDDSECAAPRPADNQLCNMVTCRARWEAGPWNKCSRSCGGGTKTRELRCQQRMHDGTVVDKGPSMCKQKKPAHMRSCNKRVCRGEQIIPSNQSYEQETPQRKVTLKIGGTATVFEGTTVQLKCPVRYFDRSKIVWAKDGTRLDLRNRKYRGKGNGQVSVRHVENRDAGRYTCIAGSVNASLVLSIRPNPNGEPPWMIERRLRRQRMKQRRNKSRQKQRARKQKLAEAATADHLSNTIDSTSRNRPQFNSRPMHSPGNESPSSINDVLASDQQAIVDSDQPKPEETAVRDLEFKVDQVRSSSGRVEPHLQRLVSGLKGIVFGNNRGRQRSRWGRRSTTTTTTSTTTTTTSTTTTTASTTTTSTTDDDVTTGTAKGTASTAATAATTAARGGDGATVAAPASVAAAADPLTTRSDSRTFTPGSPSHGLGEGQIEVLGKGDPSEVQFEWLISGWSECSRTCGGSGIQLRGTQCLVRLKNATRIVSSALCEDANLPSPRDVRPCGQMPCPSWHVTDWRPCRRSRCVQWNYAMQRRKVNCRLPNGTVVHSRLCDRRQRPAGRQECYNDRCKGSWRVEPWSACSARCGAAGYQTRILRCVWYGTNKPAGNTCRDQPRPMVYKPCMGPTCPPWNGCRDRMSFCARARKLSLCSMQKIRSECCRTCLDVG